MTVQRFTKRQNRITYAMQVTLWSLAVLDRVPAIRHVHMYERVPATMPSSDKYAYCTVFKYRRHLSIVACLIAVGDNILHCVLAVMTVIITVLRE